MISKILETKNYLSISVKYKKCRKYNQTILLKNDFLIYYSYIITIIMIFFVVNTENYLLSEFKKIFKLKYKK